MEEIPFCAYSQGQVNWWCPVDGPEKEKKKCGRGRLYDQNKLGGLMTSREEEHFHAKGYNNVAVYERESEELVKEKFTVAVFLSSLVA